MKGQRAMRPPEEDDDNEEDDEVVSKRLRSQGAPHMPHHGSLALFAKVHWSTENISKNKHKEGKEGAMTVHVHMDTKIHPIA